MPLFNENIPDSEFVVDPTYLPDDKKWIAAIAGFKQTGERNAFGKVARFLPGFGSFTRNGMAQQFKGDGFNTFLENVNDNKTSDHAASMAGIGGLIMAGGTLSELIAPGNPLGISAIGQGAKMTMSGAAGVTNDVNLSDDWGSSFHPMKKGGEMKHWWDGDEDLAMIDKKTGRHVGDISYGERVMSKSDNLKMKELKEDGKIGDLGRFVAKAMDRQPDYEEEEGLMEAKKGGVLSAEKAKQILKDGTVYGKPISKRQRKFFGFVANGGDPKKYKSEPIEYANGATIIDMGGGRSYNNPWDTAEKISTQLGGPEQIFNAAQFLMGMQGTKGDLPEFKEPDAWSQYLLQLHKDATMGFTGPEAGAIQNANERKLTAGLNYAHETSGGNGAFSVGDASRFAGDYIDHAMKFAAANAEMKRKSQQVYGNALLQDVNMDKENFMRKYEEKLREKTAAGDLARTGLQSMINQMDYSKNYGPGSINNQYLKSLIEVNKNLSGLDYGAILKAVFDKDPAAVTGTPPAAADATVVSTVPKVQSAFLPPSLLNSEIERSPILPEDPLWYLNYGNYNPQSQLPTH